MRGWQVLLRGGQKTRIHILTSWRWRSRLLCLHCFYSTRHLNLFCAFNFMVLPPAGSVSWVEMDSRSLPAALYCCCKFLRHLPSSVSDLILPPALTIPFCRNIHQFQVSAGFCQTGWMLAWFLQTVYGDRCNWNRFCGRERSKQEGGLGKDDFTMFTS